MSESTAVVSIEPKAKAPLTAGGHIAAIIPRDAEEAFRIAKAVVNAGLAPSSYNNDPQKILIAILTGLELGLPPMSALKSIAIINGRPSIYGEGVVALVQSKGALEWMKERIDGQPMTDDWTAVCIVKRRGQEEPYERRFSWADANRAKLTNKGPWREYPQRMLRWRAASWALRDAFADALMGLYIAEEAQDMPPVAVAIDSTALADEAPANDTPMIEHKPEPSIFTLRDATGKDLGSFAAARGYLNALRASLDVAGDSDRHALWHNNRETVAGLMGEYESDREAMFARYDSSAAAE